MLPLASFELSFLLLKISMVPTKHKHEKHNKNKAGRLRKGRIKEKEKRKQS